ncbi:cytochrome c oxidase subunit 3 [Aureivirga marina]|uniref:cytochrome c oxidase subunit 3 n=1 Tax=Aureivirga marina TaxID=1182451 RepID=UPI0018CAC9C6|nr:cytochrome c oxidase subunit 3 [Aureivirga marina]
MKIVFRQTKLLMQLFIASESLFFVALIIAYIYFRNFSDTWEASTNYLNVKRTAIFSIFLFSSSGTITVAKYALENNKRKLLISSLILTILLGATFVFGQVTEYMDLYQQEVTIDQNIFGSAFFTLTGFHGFHVFLGLIILTIYLILTLLDVFRMRDPSSAFLAAEWYWHFVDVVWVFVFFIVYLMPLL